MHTDSPARPDDDAETLPDTAAPVTTSPPATEAVREPAPVMLSEGEGEATLRLLRSCVEAMHLLQAKVDSVEHQIVEQRATGAREAATLRADFAALQTSRGEEEARLGEAEKRIARLDDGVQDFAQRHAEDVASARSEAATWRMRVETDSMAFDQLSGRLTTLENGLSVKLEQAERTIAERESDNVRLKTEVRIVENASDQLRMRLSGLDATIADQRARIASLQNKLATATYAIRFEHLARTNEAIETGDILDLGTLPNGSLISAA